MRRYVLTGAPGCGKTTVAAVLGQRGYVVVAEAATDVIDLRPITAVLPGPRAVLATTRFEDLDR